MKKMMKFFAFAVLFHGIAVGATPSERVFTLQEAYQSALESNETVKISEESLIQSEARIDQAWSYVYPRVTGQAGYRRYNEVLPPGDDSSFIFQPLSQLQASLVLKQPLYTGGRTMAALRTAETMREMSSRDLNGMKQDTLLTVAGAYYGLLKAEKLVEKSRASLKRMQHHLNVTEREASTRRTKANISNLLRARTLVSQARIFLTRDENSVRVARQKLSLVSRVPEDAALAEPAPEPAPGETLDELKARALANRDDLAYSELNRKVADENVILVKGAYYPQAYAEGALQYVDSHPATLTDGSTYYGGVRVEVPIFEGGRMRSELSEARSRRRQAELAVQYLQRAVETDVYEAYVNYQTVSSVRSAAQLQYDDARSNFDAVENLFGQGLVSGLGLIDAQQALFVSERELVHAEYDEQLAILRLRKSTGTLGNEKLAVPEGRP
jgi:outer membrane protein TolC